MRLSQIAFGAVLGLTMVAAKCHRRHPTHPCSSAVDCVNVQPRNVGGLSQNEVCVDRHGNREEWIGTNHGTKSIWLSYTVLRNVFGHGEYYEGTDRKLIPPRDTVILVVCGKEYMGDAPYALRRIPGYTACFVDDCQPPATTTATAEQTHACSEECQKLGPDCPELPLENAQQRQAWLEFIDAATTVQQPSTPPKLTFDAFRMSVDPACSRVGPVDLIPHGAGAADFQQVAAACAAAIDLEDTVRVRGGAYRLTSMDVAIPSQVMGKMRQYRPDSANFLFTLSQTASVVSSLEAIDMHAPTPRDSVNDRIAAIKVLPVKGSGRKIVAIIGETETCLRIGPNVGLRSAPPAKPRRKSAPATPTPKRRVP